MWLTVVEDVLHLCADAPGEAERQSFVGPVREPSCAMDESNWVVNGIITVAILVVLVPLVAGVVDRLDALLLVAGIVYVVYTTLSGEAIDPPRPK
jgi:hypothetical protein